MNSRKLQFIIKILLYVIAVSPLIITPFTIYPFIFGRGIFIQILIELAFSLYLVLAIFNKNYRPVFKGLLKIFILFIGILFISSFLGLDFNRSFWGTEQRFTGWFFQFHILLFFIIIASVFRSKNDWKKYLTFNIYVALVTFVIATLSLFGVKFWGVDLGKRIAGFLGNPLFFATYLILNLGFSLYLFAQAKLFKNKIFWLTISFTFIYGILLTQSRGALLGLIIGLFFGLAFYGFYFKDKKVRIIILGVIVFLIMIGSVIYFFRENNFIKDISFLRRFTSGSFTTANTRFLSWEIAGKAILEKPVLGWGVENFYIAFNKYYNPELLKYSYYETWFDKPHNKLLELGVDGGIFVVIIYLLIYIFSLKYIIDYYKNEKISLLQASALGGVFVAYFIQNLFVFDTPTSYLSFSILLAMLLAFRSFHIKVEDNRISKTYISVAVFLSLIPVYFFNISPLYASVKLRQNTTLYNNNQKINIEGYKKAMALFNPYREEWREDLAKTAISSLRQKNNVYSDKERDFALLELKKNVTEHQNDAYYHMLLGGFYAELAKDDDYKNLAKEEFDKALELSPKRQHIYFNLGRFYTVLEDREKVIETFKQAIKLKDDVALSYWEGAKQLLILDDADEKAREWVIKALELNFLPSDKGEFLFIFNNFSDYFLEVKNYQVLLHMYERMQIIEPNNPQWFAQSATLYYILGDYKTAIKDVNHAVELDYNYKQEGDAFIKLIESQINK